MRPHGVVKGLRDRQPPLLHKPHRRPPQQSIGLVNSLVVNPSGRNTPQRRVSSSSLTEYAKVREELAAGPAVVCCGTAMPGMLH